ncbi:MAG: hypothetical protein ACRCSM_03660 [Sediminibacterium sp.]|jgi:hypothetical protein|nr:hypothetical protein [Chitinophagaceae bacterium]MCA6446728.1 hypothetical protein [Chitinophagaceae bacterium]
MEDLTLFRSLSARITAAIIFFVIVLMMIYGQLPYQLPIDSSVSKNTTLVLQIIAVLGSCSLIIFFFIPTRMMGIMAIISMFLLFISYEATNTAYLASWMICTPLLPFCLHDERMFAQLKFQKWIVFLLFGMSFMFYSTKLFESIANILYLLPFFPYHTVVKWTANQLEPR